MPRLFEQVIRSKWYNNGTFTTVCMSNTKNRTTLSNNLFYLGNGLNWRADHSWNYMDYNERKSLVSFTVVFPKAAVKISVTHLYSVFITLNVFSYLFELALWSIQDLRFLYFLEFLFISYLSHSLINSSGLSIRKHEIPSVLLECFLYIDSFAHFKQKSANDLRIKIYMKMVLPKLMGYQVTLWSNA